MHAYIYIHKYTHTHIYIYIHNHTHIYINMHMRMYSDTYTDLGLKAYGNTVHLSLGEWFLLPWNSSGSPLLRFFAWWTGQRNSLSVSGRGFQLSCVIHEACVQIIYPRMTFQKQEKGGTGIGHLAEWPTHWLIAWLSCFLSELLLHLPWANSSLSFFFPRAPAKGSS